MCVSMWGLEVDCWFYGLYGHDVLQNISFQVVALTWIGAWIFVENLWWWWLWTLDHRNITWVCRCRENFSVIGFYESLSQGWYFVPQSFGVGVIFWMSIITEVSLFLFGSCGIIIGSVWSIDTATWCLDTLRIVVKYWGYMVGRLNTTRGGPLWSILCFYIPVNW